MIPCVINFILFCVILVSYYAYKRSVDVPFILIFLYAFIALMGIFYFPKYGRYIYVQLWPFVYLIVICLLYFIPVIRAKGIYNNCSKIRINQGLKIMFIIYVVCAFIKIGDNFLLVKDAISTGDWLTMKADLYNGGTIGSNIGTIGYLSNLYVSVFMHAILIYSMYTFTQSNISTLRSILLLLVSIVPYIMTCILYVYRGGLLIISYLILSAFLLYYKRMVPNKRNALFILLSIVALFILVLTLSISVSRFGETDAGGSIVDYLGQSMLVFNAGIATEITSYANGKYFFLNFLGLEKSDVWIDALYNIHTSNGSALNTFVGCSYVDFGPFLTLIVAIFICHILSAIFRRKRIDFADLYLFVFYLDFLFLGVFHCTEGFSLSVFMATVLYLVLKIAGRLTIKRIVKK